MEEGDREGRERRGSWRPSSTSLAVSSGSQVMMRGPSRAWCQKCGSVILRAPVECWLASGTATNTRRTCLSTTCCHCSSPRGPGDECSMTGWRKGGRRAIVMKTMHFVFHLRCKKNRRNQPLSGVRVVALLRFFAHSFSSFFPFLSEPSSLSVHRIYFCRILLCHAALLSLPSSSFPLLIPFSRRQSLFGLFKPFVKASFSSH